MFHSYKLNDVTHNLPLPTIRVRQKFFEVNEAVHFEIKV